MSTPADSHLAHAHPRRHPDVIVSQQQENGRSVYWLKQPHTQALLRLTAAEYAFWWRMDGQTPLRDLLVYYWRRYHQIPYHQLKTLLATFQADHFVLSAVPIEPPATGFPLIGLDDLFNPLQQRLAPFFSWLGQLLALFVLFVGGTLFIGLLLRQRFGQTFGQTFGPFPAGAWSLLTLPLAYLLVVCLRQLGRGLWLTQAGGTVTNGRFFWHRLLPQLELDLRERHRLTQRQQLGLAFSGSVTLLLLLGVVGLLLTAVSTYAATLINNNDLVSQLGLGFLYQVGLLAGLHVLLSLNPLADSDGANLLALAAPNRPRWGAALFYLTAVFLAARYLWQTQLASIWLPLWQSEPWGRFWLTAMSLALLPPLPWLWQQSRAWRVRGQNWLAKRPLFTRPDALFVLLALPLLGLPFFGIGLGIWLQNSLIPTLLIALLHLGGLIVWFRLATRQPANAQLTAIFWLLLLVLLCLTCAWLGEAVPILRTGSLLLASFLVLFAGGYAGFTLTPRPLPLVDLVLMVLLLLLGILFGLVLAQLQASLTAVSLLLLAATTLGLSSLVPAVRNFRQTDFIYPWTILFFVLLLLPWLFFYPQLHFLITAIWLFVGVFQLVLHSLLHKKRPFSPETAPFSTTFQRFIQRLLDQATTLVGERPLTPIHPQLAAVQFHKGTYTVPQQSFLLLAARLGEWISPDAVATMVRQTVQTLPWQAQQQLVRRVLLPTGWDEPLTDYVQQAYAERRDLLKQTAVFPPEALSDLLALAAEQTVAAGQTVAAADIPCTHWFLLLSGRLRVGAHTMLTPGCWFGGEALAGQAVYEATVVAETAVQLLALPHAHLLPLLRRHRHARQQLAQMSQLVPKLRQCPALAALDTAGLLLLAAHAEPVTLAAGEQTADGFYWVETGELRQGDQPLAARCFGLGSLLTAADPVIYQATRPSKLWRLSPQRFEQLLNGRFFT